MNEELINGEMDKKFRPVLFIDVPGVLNSSGSQFNYTNFDADKIKLLREIVESTGCEVCFAPVLPQSKSLILIGHFRRQVDTIVNLMQAIFPQRKFSVVYDVSESIKMFAGENDRIDSFAVVRHVDTPGLEWRLTYPTRSMRIGNGMTKADANSIIRLLKTPHNGDEIPLQVVNSDMVKEMVRQRFHIRASRW